MKQKRRTKRLMALALLLASVLGLAGALQIRSVSVTGTELEATPTSVVSQIAEWNTYINDKYGYSVKYPRDWVKLEHSSDYVRFFKGSNVSTDPFPRLYFSILTRENPFNLSLEEWLSEHRPSRETPDIISVGSAEAMKWTTADIVGKGSIIIYLERESVIYQIAFVLMDSYDERVVGIFDQMLNTFSFVAKQHNVTSQLGLISWQSRLIPTLNTLLTAYDRQATYTYAQNYWWRPVDDCIYYYCTVAADCNSYSNCSSHNDCIHFVSHVMLAGGIDNGHIVNAQTLAGWFQSSGNGSFVSSQNSLDKGDVILYSWDGGPIWDHGAVVIANNGGGDVRIAEHSFYYNGAWDHWDLPWTNFGGPYPNEVKYGFVAIAGGGPTPPAAPSNLSASATGQTSIHLSWNDNSNSEDGFKVYRNGSQVATVGANNTSYDDNGLSCGTTYSYYVKAYNSAGDSDPSNTASATTNNCSPPPAPSLSSPSNGASLRSCENITLDWNESSGASEYYAEYWGTGSGNSGWRSNTDWNIGTKSPGTYYWHAKARNQYGESGWSDTWSFTVNPNQAPNTPSIQSPGDGAWVNSRTITLQWQDNGDPDNCPHDYRTYNAEISRSGWSNSVSNYSGTSWQVTVPSDDDYQWRVQAYDGDLTSGWSGYRTVRVDATPPDTSITNGPSGVITIGSATFTWTGSDNRTSTADLVYSCRLVGLSSDWSSWSTATSVTYNGLTDGDYTFEVKAKDKAGNEDPSPAMRSFGVDVTPPETTITSGPSGCIGTADTTFTWTGSDNRTPTAELFYSCKLEGFDDWSAWASATSKSYTNLPDGDYTFKVKAKDGVGHEDPSPAARSFRVDTTPPTGSVLINGGDSTTNKIAVHLDITGDDGPVGCGVTEMRLSNDDHNWEAWQSFATEGEWLLPTLNRTTWTMHLQLKDLVGNVSGAFTDDIYLDLYPPRPSSESYQLGARVVASGHLTSTSESYGLLSATVGQPIADGRMQGADYRLESGYQGAWPSVPRGRPPAESYDINASLTASGGGYQTSESYRLQSAMGQSTDVGPRSSENYQLLSGYLPCKLFGDLDGNGRVDVADIMQVASRWRCRRGDDCYDECYDLDHDDDIDIVDIMKVAANWGETC